MHRRKRRVLGLVGAMVAIAVPVQLAFGENLVCPPDCTGTPEHDYISGNNFGNTIESLGGPDEISAAGGPDDARGGEGDGDTVWLGPGKGDVGRGGSGDHDIVTVQFDSDKDYLYGGPGSADICFGYANDYIDPSCEG